MWGGGVGILTILSRLPILLLDRTFHTHTHTRTFGDDKKFFCLFDLISREVIKSITISNYLVHYVKCTNSGVIAIYNIVNG